MRQKLMWAAVVAGAAFYIFSFFVGDEPTISRALHLGEIETGLSRAINIVATMAQGLGIISLVWVHGGNIARRKKGWPQSIVVCVTFLAVASLLLWQYRLDAQRRALESETAVVVRTYEAALHSTDAAVQASPLANFTPAQRELLERYYRYQATYQFQPRKFFLDTIYSPLAASVMSLLGFYITYAAYRAFRVRSLEATVMMLSAAIVIVGSDPLGNWLSHLIGGPANQPGLLHLPTLADLATRVMNSGMQRGLWVGISVAIIAVSVRILLGFERGLFEVRQGED
jgi:hypothetical protein